MMQKSNVSDLRVSLVIPAFNEEAHLQACLRAAMAQRLPFDEIIVIDNNSTDATVAIARRFPGVRVVTEPQQGKVYARTAGFNAATGDIIARIDADTLLPVDWSVQLQRIFADPVVQAVSGMPVYYDVPLKKACNAVENTLRQWMAYTLRDSMFLQGANMALRRNAWQTVKSSLCAEDRLLHEDFDIALHMQQHGLRVVFDSRLVAGLSARCVDVSFPFFITYLRMNSHTYAVHGAPHFRRMYPVMVMTVLFFWPARILFRGYNPQTGTFSFARFMAKRRTVNPRLASMSEGYYLS